MAVKPKLALIPSGVKASKVYSVLPSDGVGDFDFSRSGEATRINKDGLIETVDSNVPRLNYPLIDGVVSGCPSLLLENSATNLVTYSEDFSNAYWTKSGASVTSGFISPDGTANAFKLVEDTSVSAQHVAYVFITTTASVDYAQSYYFKKGERNYAYISTTGGLSGTAIFDLNLGVISYEGVSLVDAKIEALADDWYKCEVTANIAGTSMVCQIGTSINGTSLSHTGDGTSGVYIWGAMLEANSFSTSYIPTSGSSATRSAETCNNSGDVNTFNDSEGVLMAEISALSETTDIRVISISDGTINNMVFIRFDTLNRIIAEVTVSGGGSVNPFYNVPSVTSFNKIALKWKLNDVALWINGIEVDTISVIGQFAPNTLNVMNLSMPDFSKTMNANTKQIQYFDTALTDTDLEELTSWQSFNEMATSQQYSIL